MTADDQKRICGAAARQPSRGVLRSASIMLAGALALISPQGATAAAPTLFETFEAVCVKAMPDLVAAADAAKRLGLTIPEGAKVDGPDLADATVLLLGSPPDGVQQFVFLGSGENDPLGVPGVENRICNVTATSRDDAGRTALGGWLGDLPSASDDEQTALYLFTESPEGRVALNSAKDPEIMAAARSGRLVMLVVNHTPDQTSFTLVRTMPVKEAQ